MESFGTRRHDISACHRGRTTVSGIHWNTLERISLSDAEAAEDHAEQIVRRKRAGDARQLGLRQAQLFGEQVEPLIGLGCVRGGEVEVLARRAQRDQVAFARQVQQFAGLLPAGDAQQFGAQQVDPEMFMRRQLDATSSIINANPEAPIFAELRAIVQKTCGVADVARVAREPFLPAIEHDVPKLGGTSYTSGRDTG
jgi:hypothetical protein